MAVRYRQMRAGNRVEVIIKVHAEDGEVYVIRDERVVEPVTKLAQERVDKIDWQDEPHHKDDENPTQLSI